MTTHTPTQHSSVVGGSSASRVLNCPGSVRLTQTLPEPPESEYAAEGTALHNAIEHVLYEGLSDEDGKLADYLEGREFYGVTLNREQAETVVTALGMFDEYWDLLVEEDGEEPVFAIETQVAFPGIEDAFGTADILMKTSKRSVVWDWKFGAGVAVSAHENRQMAFYARGAAHSAPAFFWPDGQTEDGADAGKRDVEFVIAQPRISEEPSRYTVKFADLVGFQDELVAAVATIDDPDVRFGRGDHCRWCRAAAVCPAYDREANQLADLLDGTAEAAGTEPTREQQAAITVNGGGTPTVLTPELMADWLVTADIVEHWAKSVRALAMEQALAGNPPEDMKLVTKYSNLTYVDKDDPDKVDKMLANRGLSAKERRKITPITPTHANKLLKKMGKKQLTDKQAQRYATGYSMVPVDDPREEVKMVSDAAAGELAEALGS